VPEEVYLSGNQELLEDVEEVRGGSTAVVCLLQLDIPELVVGNLSDSNV